MAQGEGAPWHTAESPPVPQRWGFEGAFGHSYCSLMRGVAHRDVYLHFLHLQHFQAVAEHEGAHWIAWKKETFGTK